MHQSRSALGSLALGLLSALLAGQASVRAQEAARSVHDRQQQELGDALLLTTDDARLARDLADQGRLFPGQGAGAALDPPLSQQVQTDPRDLIVFGYLQSESQVFHLRWQALTHVGSRFVGFNSSGALTGKSAFTARSSYLKAGGAADAAGVKVILVVNQFDDDPGGVIETVMTSAARRSKLVGEIVALLAADGYCHGVSLDLEFSWGSHVRDGITAFMTELRQALDQLDEDLETSIYTHAIYSTTLWDFDAQTGLTPQVDYMLYSMYDWATGSTARAISDFDNCLGSTRMHAYLDAGLPPEKLVAIVSAYSRRWDGVSTYGGSGWGSASSGYTDALFDVTLNPGFGGPQTGQYVPGDEAGWYTWNDGVPHVRTWEAREGMEWKIRHCLSMQDPNGVWNGRRLGGVGFWSLYWLAETSSVDPRTGGTVARTRTYPEVYQMCQELLAAPGDEDFLLEGFEGYDPRWRNPYLAPDTLGDLDGDSDWQLVNTPPGLPDSLASTHAAQVRIDVEGGGLNQVVFAHEVLASPLAPTVTDVHATLGHVDRFTRLVAHVWTSQPHPGWDVSLLLVDGQGELEASPPEGLWRSGWSKISWDLSEPGTVEAFSTQEPAFLSGDAVLDTAGGGARDLSPYGFVFRGSGPLSAPIVVDQLRYESTASNGPHYTLNELRYDGAADEFLELWGPAGPLPSDLELRFYDPDDGSVLRSLPLSGSIEDAGNGWGPFVLGDPGVPNLDSSAGMSPSTNDLPDGDPSGCQLIEASSGRVHDSLVWEAFGGLDELIRRECRGVTDEGQPWVGNVADGEDTTGQPYSIGRYPDGRDRDVNGWDFSFMVSSPGAGNGDRLALPARLDFETPPAALFQTFDRPRFVDPQTAGLPASPDGGLAWRCVDLAGGGVIGALGDAALGAEQGYRWRGEVHVPGPSAPAAAIGLGLAGRQGSAFFGTTSQDRKAYETGLWLIYENAAGVGMADGRPDHPGVWELGIASHDNQDASPLDVLISKTDADLDVQPGSWVTFEFRLHPFDAAGARVQVLLNGRLLFSGPLPEDLDVSGALQIGFRENHSGDPGPAEGVWLDGVTVEALGPGLRR